MVQLEWSQIDSNCRCAWIHADQAKARKAIAVPLNDDALQVLQELGGWSDYSMVLRYAHLSVEHLAEYADNLSRSHLNSTNLVHSARKEKRGSRGDLVRH